MIELRYFDLIERDPSRKVTVIEGIMPLGKMQNADAPRSIVELSDEQVIELRKALAEISEALLIERISYR